MGVGWHLLVWLTCGFVISARFRLWCVAAAATAAAAAARHGGEAVFQYFHFEATKHKCAFVGKGKQHSTIWSAGRLGWTSRMVFNLASHWYTAFPVGWFHVCLTFVHRVSLERCSSHIAINQARPKWASPESASSGSVLEFIICTIIWEADHLQCQSRYCKMNYNVVTIDHTRL